jgi:hypothetical protein
MQGKKWMCVLCKKEKKGTVLAKTAVRAKKKHKGIMVYS